MHARALHGGDVAGAPVRPGAPSDEALAGDDELGGATTPRLRRRRLGAASPPPPASDPYCTITCSINKVFMVVVFLVGVLGSGIFTTVFAYGTHWSAPAKFRPGGFGRSWQRPPAGGGAFGRPEADEPWQTRLADDGAVDGELPRPPADGDARSASHGAPPLVAPPSAGTAAAPRAVAAQPQPPAAALPTSEAPGPLNASPSAAATSAAPAPAALPPPPPAPPTPAAAPPPAAAPAPAKKDGKRGASAGAAAAAAGATPTATRTPPRTPRATRTPKRTTTSTRSTSKAPREAAAAATGDAGAPSHGRKAAKPRVGPFGGLVVNASDVVGDGNCTFAACPAADPASPHRDKPYRIFNATRPASSLPFVHVIVNHRNRFSNLNRLLQSVDAALAGDAVLRSCVCVVLVDFASDVAAVQDDPRAVCLPPWDSFLPVPGTLGADAYQEPAVQDAAYSALLGAPVATDAATGQLVVPPGASARCADTVYGLPTADALTRLLRRYRGEGLLLNATRHFDSYSRAGLLSLGMAAVRTPPQQSLLFLVDADMLVRPGWFEEMLDHAWPWKQVYLPVVWSACYGANASTFPTSPAHPPGRESRGWWRTTGTGMVVAYMKDIHRCGGYGTDFVGRGDYGSEDWGLEHRIRRFVRVYRQNSVTLFHPHHAQNRNWRHSIDGMRSVRTGRYQCTRASGDPCGCRMGMDGAGASAGGGNATGGGADDAEDGDSDAVEAPPPPPPRADAAGAGAGDEAEAEAEAEAGSEAAAAETAAVAPDAGAAAAPPPHPGRGKGKAGTRDVAAAVAGEAAVEAAVAPGAEAPAVVAAAAAGAPPVVVGGGGGAAPLPEAVQDERGGDAAGDGAAGGDGAPDAAPGDEPAAPDAAGGEPPAAAAAGEAADAADSRAP